MEENLGIKEKKLKPNSMEVYKINKTINHN